MFSSRCRFGLLKVVLIWQFDGGGFFNWVDLQLTNDDELLKEKVKFVEEIWKEMRK